jgi:hypothetical protein
MRDDQTLIILKPDGTVFDPSRTTSCMLDALKTVGGVTAPTVGFIWDPEDGPRPFIRYTYPSRLGGIPTEITYTAGGELGSDPERWQYFAPMSGLHSTGEGPDTFGADKIAKLWKNRCGVDAIVFFS